MKYFFKNMLLHEFGKLFLKKYRIISKVKQKKKNLTINLYQMYLKVRYMKRYRQLLPNIGQVLRSHIQKIRCFQLWKQPETICMR